LRQWYPRNRSPFCKYLVSKGIIGQDELSGLLANEEDEPNPEFRKSSTSSSSKTKPLQSHHGG